MDKIKVLIVDDVVDNRLVLKAACRRLEGFEIQEAEDGEEAVEMAKQWHPDIILMDVLMPKMDGFEASRTIKNIFPKTVIMIITAVTDKAMQKNLSDIGSTNLSTKS
jgi:CheY-like chemotaxis protein